MRALARADSGDQQQVAGSHDLGLAVIAPPIDQVALVAPLDGSGLGEVFADQVLQPRAPIPVDGRDLVDVVLARRPVAQDELDRVIGGDSQPHQVPVVRGELEQRGDLDGAGELGVLDSVASVGLPDEEVGEPDRRRVRVGLVEEGGLKHDRGAGFEGCTRGGGRFAQADRVDSRPGDLDDTVAVLDLELRQLGLLVDVTQRAGALEHRVLVDVEGRDAPQLDVEHSEKRELALRGERQVGGTRDDDLGGSVEEEHRAPIGWAMES